MRDLRFERSMFSVRMRCRPQLAHRAWRTRRESNPHHSGRQPDAQPLGVVCKCGGTCRSRTLPHEGPRGFQDRLRATAPARSEKDAESIGRFWRRRPVSSRLLVVLQTTAFPFRHVVMERSVRFELTPNTFEACCSSVELRAHGDLRGANRTHVGRFRRSLPFH